MNRNAYTGEIHLSFGDIGFKVLPTKDFQGQEQEQVLDAMTLAGQTAMSAWALDYTIDPQHTNGKQEKITADVIDGQRKIAVVEISAPTTSSYSKTLFESFVTEKLVPAILNAYRSYASTYSTPQEAAASDRGLMATKILPDALADTRVTPNQLRKQTR